MKHLILTFMCLLFIGFHAQAKPEVADKYDRISLTIIVCSDEVENSEYSKKRMNEWLNSLYTQSNINKFDINYIDTKVFPLSRTRWVKSLSAASMEKVVKPQIDKHLVDNNTGKQIVSYILNRNKRGEMNGSIIEKRGLYNASATDEIDAQAAALGQNNIIKATGYSLLKNNYILVVNFAKEGMKETIAESLVDLAGTFAGQSDEAIVGTLYKLELDDYLINDVLFDQAWIYQEDDKTTREEKIKLFDEIEYQYSHIGTFTQEHESTKLESFNNLISKIENNVTEWEVTIPVVSTKPIEARIGTKESLKNKNRYYAYKHVLNRNNEVVAKKTAVLRATTIAENENDNTLTSEFVKIAGYSVDEGYILKQSNDLGLSYNLGYRMGVMDAYTASFDWLMTTKTNNVSSYSILDISYNTYNIANLYEDENSATLPSSEYYGDKINLVHIEAGVGFGYRFMTKFELEARYKLGFPILLSETDFDTDTETDEDATYTTYSHSLGAKLKVNIVYPLKFFIGAEYLYAHSELTDETESIDYYTYRCDILEKSGINTSGIAFSCGLSYTF